MSRSSAREGCFGTVASGVVVAGIVLAAVWFGRTARTDTPSQGTSPAPAVVPADGSAASDAGAPARPSPVRPTDGGTIPGPSPGPSSGGRTPVLPVKPVPRSGPIEAYARRHSLVDGVHELEWEWRGYRGGYSIAARLAEADRAASVAEFGFTNDELQQAWERTFEEALRHADPDVRIRAHGGAYDVQSRVLGRQELRAVMNAAESQAIEGKRTFLATRGLALDVARNVIQVDLRAEQERNIPRLAELARAVHATALANGGDLDALLDAMLALVQRMPYVKPPDVAGGRQIVGFWPPPETAVRSEGDCDTKSVLFATLWGALRPGELLLVLLPDHALLGIRGVHARSAAETVVRVGGVDYGLCELTTFGWWPGRISEDIRRQIEAGRATWVPLR
jgi:hypothetical protein